MIADQVVSISELRKNATKYVKKARDTKQAQYIFINNKPQWAIVNIEWLENVNKYFVQAYPDDIQAFEESSHWEEWVEAFAFLESLNNKDV